MIDWKQRIRENDDLDIHEVIAVRAVGKTEFGLEWVTTDADISIVIAPNSRMSNYIVKDFLHYGMYNGNKVQVTHNYHYLRGLRLSPDKKIRVYVDEYLMQDFSLDDLDEVIGHENYKVLFMGSQQNKDDGFRINFSKHYVVGVDYLLRSGDINEEEFLKSIRYMDDESFYRNYCLPTELN